MGEASGMGLSKLVMLDQLNAFGLNKKWSVHE